MLSDQRNFIVYKSSAGSGKTFTLVREYLKIALKNPDAFRQILAITFTNKAANEMKERVVRYLMALAEPTIYPEPTAEKYLLPELSAFLKMDEDTIRKRAADVLARIIHHYAEFAISTIDSFTHRVVRTFAHDLRIPMNFEVELDSDMILVQAVDILLSMAGSEEQLTRVLVEFVEKKAGDEKSWQIENDLARFGKLLLSESSFGAVSELRKLDLSGFLEIRKELHRYTGAFESQIRELAMDCIRLIRDAGIAPDDFNYKDKGVYGYLEKLSQGRYDKLKPGVHASNAFTSGEWLNRKASQQARDAFEMISDRLNYFAGTLTTLLDKDLQTYMLYRLILGQIYSTALLSVLEKILNGICEDNNKLLISEFNRRISSIVRDQPAPFIYERLGEKYHHYLIDEFQDTSVMQWHNLLPLVENSLASGRMNLVVGDAKQAIYRWRSGDVEQFEKLPRLIKSYPDPILNQRENALVENYMEKSLAQNHRSAPVIVDFNNRFFTFVSELLPPGYGQSYRNAVQTVTGKEKPGLVKIQQVTASEDEESSYDDRMMEAIYKQISELRDDNFEWKDIAILCRKNEKAAKIAEYLVSKKIPVISSESLLVAKSAKVGFLLAWIRHLTDPEDEIQKVHILAYLKTNGYLLNTFLEDFFNPKKDSPSSLFREVINGQEGFIGTEKLRTFEIYGLIRYISHYYNLGADDDIYLRFFQDAVITFLGKERGGLPEFIDWWEEQQEKLSVIIPSGINAVRIMTIHKAKGLQFPVVIYPFADEKLRPGIDNIWVEIEDERLRPLRMACLPVAQALKETVYQQNFDDEMNRSLIDLVNVLYVVMTRPEERLYILMPPPPEKTEDANSVPKLLNRFLKDGLQMTPSADVFLFGQRWKMPSILSSSDEKENNLARDGRPVLNMLLKKRAPESWDIENPDRNRDWGKLVHLALSLITVKDQTTGVLADLDSQGLIPHGKSDELKEQVLNVLNHPAMAPFFSPMWEVRNEPEIIAPDGHLYRPDRVLINDGEAILLDFKTGKKDESHKDQIARYGKLITEMGLQIRGGYLVYVQPVPDIIKVL